jgi:nicotinate-nucleotide adenylyltransferase
MSGGNKIIAILGGSFNPIHKDHIRICEVVLSTLYWIDEIWIIPVLNHKFSKELISPEHRLNMCSIVVSNPKIKVMDYEIKNNLTGDTFTLITKLKEEYKNYKFYYIIGQDNADCFDKWYKAEELKKLINFIVIPRKGIIKNNKVDWYLKQPHIYLNTSNNIENISSTLIRNKLKYGLNVEEYLDKNVLEYIKENKIYI